MKKGFTLVEILAAISLLVIIGLFMTTGYLSMIRLNQQAIIDRRNIHEASVNFAHKNTSLTMIGDSLSVTFSIDGRKVSRKVVAYQDETTGLVYYELIPEASYE